MKRSQKKIITLIMAVALAASSSAFAGISVYADNEDTNAVVEVETDAIDLNAAQQEAYDKITAACTSFLDSDSEQKVHPILSWPSGNPLISGEPDPYQI